MSSCSSQAASEPSSVSELSSCRQQRRHACAWRLAKVRLHLCRRRKREPRGTNWVTMHRLPGCEQAPMKSTMLLCRSLRSPPQSGCCGSMGRSCRLPCGLLGSSAGAVCKGREQHFRALGTATLSRDLPCRSTKASSQQIKAGCAPLHDGHLLSELLHSKRQLGHIVRAGLGWAGLGWAGLG